MIIEIITEWRLRELEKHRKLREEGAIEVTDLIRCPLKREFEEKYPELYRASAYTPATILGSLVHLDLENILSSELNAEVEVKGEKTIGEHRIVGKIDAKIGKVGIEIKTSRADIMNPFARVLKDKDIIALATFLSKVSEQKEENGYELGFNPWDGGGS